MRRSRAASALVALAAVLALGGCGADSERVEPSGVDGLVVPTPSPDPDDFVQGVDNPYFPLKPGSEWTYDVDADGATGTRTVTVEPSDKQLAGVKVTSLVSTTTLGSDEPVEKTDYYAQDRDGNVWWFGREGEWDVESDGAQAGLAMPDVPRVGDGWRVGLLEGVVEDVATVTKVADGLVVLEIVSDLHPGVVTKVDFESGKGLVRTLAVEGPSLSLDLVSGP